MSRYIWDFDSGSMKTVEDYKQNKQGAAISKLAQQILDERQKQARMAEIANEPATLGKSNPSTKSTMSDALNNFSYVTDKLSSGLTLGLADKLSNKITDTILGDKKVEREQAQPSSKLVENIGTAAEFGGGLLSGGAAIKVVGALGKAALSPAARALKDVASKTPTIAKLGLGAGAGATGYEAFKGATEEGYAERRDTLPSKTGASLRTGTGLLVENLGYGAMRAGKDDLAESLISKGENIRKGFEVERQEFKGWRSLLDPDFYATNIAQTVPMTAALIPPMLASYKAFGATATKRGFDPFMRSIIASLGGSVVSRPLEASMEANSMYEETLKETGDKKLAEERAEKVYRNNLKLVGLDAAQLALAFAPSPFKAATTTVGKVSSGVVRLAAQAVMEGGEEGLQEAIQAWAKDEKFDIHDPQTQEAIAVGALFGLGMGGVGEVSRIMQDIKSETVKKLPDEIMPQVEEKMLENISNGMTPAESLETVLAEMAEVPEMASVIEQVTQEVVQDQVQNIKRRLGLGNLTPIENVEKQQAIPIDVVPDTQLSVKPEEMQSISTDTLQIASQQEVIPSDEQIVMPRELDGIQGEIEPQNIETVEEQKVVQDATPEIVSKEVAQEETIAQPELSNFTITKTKHTKTGEDIWVVKPKEKLSDQEFTSLNAKMRKLGAGYSRFTKGFNFKEDPTSKLQPKQEVKPDNAGTNIEVQNTEIKVTEGEVKDETPQKETAIKEKIPDKAKPGELIIKKEPKVNAEQNQRFLLVNNLRKQAEAMQKTIDAKKNPAIANQNPTARRANIAAGMYQEGERLEEIQGKLNTLANAIESGNAPEVLHYIKKKTHIETIRNILNSARHRRSNSSSLSIDDPDNIKYAKLEGYVHPDHLKTLLTTIKGKPGTKDAATIVQSIINADGRFFSESGLKAIETLSAKLPDSNTTKKYIKDSISGFKRIIEMGVTNKEQLHELLQAYIELGGNKRTEKTADRKIKEMERELIGTKIPGYFPTPKPVVEKLVDLADIEEGMKVLEPSAGKGSIADVIRESGADVDVIEINGTLSNILEAKGYSPIASDFMEYQQGGYDRIVMNPPFEKGQDIDHVLHAYDLLKPGGKLVAIMSEGPFFRNDKKATTFREWLEEVDGTSEKLPEKSFTGKDSERQTGAATRIVVVEKPEEIAATTANNKPIQFGKTAIAKTERGKSIEVQYAVINADNLIASHNTDLSTNKDYPQELQPRDRSRVASELQVSNIANNLEPEFLGESPKVSDGAPIIGSDMIVESGNGRIIALKRVYANNSANATKYKEWLIDNAEKFGVDPDRLPKNPVLVRVRQTEVDRPNFVKEANEQTVSAMSATEQARSDAEKLTDSLLDKFVPTEDGTINHYGNINFIRDFVDQVIGPTEQGKYVTKDGSISQEGVLRIRNAIFARAYGDISAIEKLAESTDNNTKNITNAMLVVAPKIAKINAVIKSGELYELSISDEITDAAKKLSQLKEAGTPIQEYLDQQSMFGEELSPLAKDILVIINKYNRSSKRIASILGSYMDGVVALGNPNQTELWGEDKPPTKAELLQSVLNRLEDANEAQVDLFKDTSVDSKATGKTTKEGRGNKEKIVNLSSVESEMDKDLSKVPKAVPKIGLQVQIVGEFDPAQNDKDIQFKDPEVEERVQAAKGKPTIPFREKLQEEYEVFKNRVTREFEHLPNDPKYMKVRLGLLTLQKQTGISVDKTIRYLRWVLLKLNRFEYDLFTRKIIIDDLYEDLPRYRENNIEDMPFGFTPDMVEKEKARMDKFLSENPKAAEAIDKRMKLWEGIKRDYIDSMKAIGFDTSGKFERNNYYHHQVLEYMGLQNVKGVYKKIKTPTNREFLKKRTANSLDYNTDYFQAEVEVMGQMLHDIEVGKVIKTVDDNHNIFKELSAKAKKFNQEGLSDIIATEKNDTKAIIKQALKLGNNDVLALYGLNADTINNPKFDWDNVVTPTEATLKSFNKRLGRAFSELSNMARNETLWAGNNGEWTNIVKQIAQSKEFDADTNANTMYRYLSELAGMEEEGSLQAAVILKNTSQRREFIKETLGNRYKTWEDLIPEGYTTWQPREGTAFYFTSSISDKLVEKFIEQGLSELEISQKDIRKVIAKGQRFKEFIIPEELALTLDNLTTENKRSSLRALTKYWKIWTLVSPRRWFKYNARNITGDADAIFCGNPSAFKKLPQAWAELYQLYFGNGVVPDNMKGWVERGGPQTLLQAQENITLDQIKMFEHIAKAKTKGDKWKEIPIRTWQKYWETARVTTDFREALLRYSAYLDYLEQMQNNKGVPKNFGASERDNIMALDSVEDRAFVLSNQLLGAYDQVSVFGQSLRETIFPFWSWNEVNFKRYRQLYINALQDGQFTKTVAKHFAIKSPIIAYRTAKFLLKAMALWGMLSAWNMLFFSDEEDELPKDVRANPHIIFGRDNEGNIIYFSRLGAFADLLEWFGMEESYSDVQDFLNGKRTLGEIVTTNLKKPANKFIQALTPFIKAPLEATAGIKFFPDAFRPSSIRDRVEYLAQQFGLENEYKSLMGRPQRPGGYQRSLKQLFYYQSNPKETAYYEALDIKRGYLKSIGKSSGGTSEPNDKTLALYYYKMAIRYKDKEAADKYLLEYALKGGTKSGLKISIRSMDPLYGLGESKKDFIESLFPEEKEKVKTAIEYYNEVIQGINAHVAEATSSKEKE